MIGLMRAGLWGLLALGVLLGAAAFADVGRPAPLVLAPSAAPERILTRPRKGDGDSLAARLVALAPFRASRRASSVGYDPGRETLPSGPAPVRPALALHGIVWGPHPGAVLEGAPGVTGDHLFLPGDTAGSIRIRRIERARVTIDGFDTTWVLRLPPPIR